MRIGLLTGPSISSFKLKVLEPILKDLKFSVEVAVADQKQRKSLVEKLKKNIRRGRGGYIIVMALKKFFSRKENGISTEKFCEENNIDMLHTSNPYSDVILERLKSYNLDILLLVGGYGIIKEPLLNLPDLGVLSYHHGNMRKYRGMPPAFWELYNNEKEIGVTVQILSPGLDCGIPVEEKSISIRNNDTLTSLRDRFYNESIDMMYSALIKLSDTEFVPEKITTFGKVYTLPNFRQWFTLQVKVFFRILGNHLKSNH